MVFFRNVVHASNVGILIVRAISKTTRSVPRVNDPEPEGSFEEEASSSMLSNIRLLFDILGIRTAALSFFAG